MADPYDWLLAPSEGDLTEADFEMMCDGAELDWLAMTLNNGDDPRALVKALAFCDLHKLALPWPLVHELVKRPELAVDGPETEQERLAIRAAALEVAEESFGVDLLDAADFEKRGVSKRQIVKLANTWLKPRLGAGTQALINWWYGTVRDPAHRGRVRSDLHWYGHFLKNAKML